jgi:hypothetical protein
MRSTAGVGEMQAFTSVLLSITNGNGETLANLASFTVISNDTLTGAQFFKTYYYNADPGSAALWGLYGRNDLRIRISYQATRAFSFQKLVVVTIDNVRLYGKFPSTINLGKI